MLMMPGQVAYAQGISLPAEMNKSFSPISIVAGGVSQLNVTIYNPNVFQLTNAAWLDNLISIQPGLSIANPVGLTNTCGGSVTAVAGTTTLSLTGGTVPAQSGITPGACTVTINVTSTTSGNLINTIPANTLTTTEQISNTTPASATLNVVGFQPPTVSKNFNPGTIWAGGTSQLSIVIRNNDPNTSLTQTAITDNLPANVFLANPASPILTGCGASASVTATSGGTPVTLSNGTVAPNSTCTITVNVTSTVQGSYLNTIPANSIQNQQGVTNAAQATARLNVDSIGIAKSFSPATFPAGGTTTLTITIQNPTGSPYTGVNVSDTLPGTVLTVVPGTATTTCGGIVSATVPRTVSLTGGTVPSGSMATPGTCTISVQVTAPAGASTDGFTNNIPAGALTTNQGVTNPRPATAAVNVSSIAVIKGFSPATFSPGGTTTLTITLQNPTSSPFTGVNVSDTLPGTVLTVIPGSEATTCGGTVTATLPRTVSLTGGTVPAGTIATPGTCTISVQVTAPLGTLSSAFTNTIPVNAVVTDQGATNTRAANAGVTVRGTDVTGAKSFVPATITQGGNSRLRIDIIAPGDTNLTNYAITDNLPIGVTVSNSAAPTITGCGAAPPRVFTAPTGATSVSLTNGLILAGQRCRIDVYVTSIASGVYTNTIPPANITNTENRAPAGDLTSTLTVTTNPNLSIQLVKGFNPISVYGGSASTMSIQLINPGNVALTNITFPDNMPNGMIIANPPNPNVGTCGGSISAVAGSGSFSFSGGTLPAFATCTLTISATMTVNGNLINVIPAQSVITAEGATNPQPARATLTNTTGASVSKFFSPNPVVMGSYSALTITIQNTGNIPLSGMGLSDAMPGALPTGLEIAGAPAPAPTNTCGGTLTAAPGTQLVQLTNGSLNASSSCTIVVSITGSVPGNYQNTIPAGALSSAQGATNSTPANDSLVVQSGVSGLTKTLSNTDLSSTTGTNVAIGEIVTYQVSIAVPPGTHLNTTLVDTMDRGLAFIGCDTIDAPGLITSIAGSFTSICSTPTTSNAGGGTPMDVDRQVTYDFGTLTNNSQADTTMTITYRAIVLDIGTNTDGTNLHNSVLWTSDTVPLGPVQTAVQIVEPELVVAKTADVNFIANGSEVTFTLALSHTQSSYSDAYDVVLIDVLPTGLDFVANSLDCTTGQQDPNTCTYNPATRTIIATWNAFTLLPTGDLGIVKIRAVGNTSIPSNGIVTNTATAEWSSLPGDHSTPQSYSNPANTFATERGYDPNNTVNVYSNSASLTLTPLGGGNGGGNNKPKPKSSTTNSFLIPVTGFAPNIQTVLNTTDRPIYNSTNTTLQIPALKVDTTIVGVKLQNGSWDVSWLQNQIGWLSGTAYPTWNGNSVLTGHAVNADGKPGIFSKLKYLQAGEYIFVYDSGYRYTYKVVSNKSVKSNDISVLKHQERAYLTLITCDNYDVKSSTYLNRVAVSAVLIDTQAIK